MNYEQFTTEEFAADERFTNWISKAKKEDVKFWENFLKNNPEKEKEIQEAKEIITTIQLGIDKSFDLDKNRLDLLNNWQNIEKENKKRSTKHRKLFVLRIAASFLLLFSLGVLYVYYNNGTSSEMEVAEYRKINKVKLILDNGENYELTDEVSGEILSADGAIIEKRGDEIQYTQQKFALAPVKYNTLIVPKGKRFTLVLSDGTKVWINSETELRYPTTFSESSRRVFLKGEAYFDVARNKHKPFIVNTSDIAVRVLGTSFNVSSYPDNESIETTLESGEIALHKKNIKYKPETAIFIQPNHQASFRKDEVRMYIKKVDTKMYTSWRNGSLIFRKEKLESLARKIERWYNVQIIFRDTGIQQIRFSGTISEEKTVGHVLELIEATSNVSYSVNENKIFLNYNPLKINHKINLPMN